MSDNFKKWLCELAKIIPYKCVIKKCPEIEINLLIKAMWAINREYFKDYSKPRIEYNIGKTNGSPGYEASYEHSPGLRTYGFFVFSFQTADLEIDTPCNSEQEALTKALEYIYKERK